MAEEVEEKVRYFLCVARQQDGQPMCCFWFDQINLGEEGDGAIARARACIMADRLGTMADALSEEPDVDRIRIDYDQSILSVDFRQFSLRSGTVPRMEELLIHAFGDAAVIGIDRCASRL